MMEGRLYIDGTDAYATFGVYVCDGGWDGLVAMPPLKDVDSEDWPEEDGVEADLDAPVLDSREVSVTFAAADFRSFYFDFLGLLSDGAYHEFDCASIGRKYRLRMVSHTSLEYVRRLGKAKVKFADDFPMEGYEYEGPESTLAADYEYTLDGQPLTAYGVRVLEGTLAEVLKPADVKENLKVDIGSLPGLIYDGEELLYKSKDVKLYCLMRAATLAGLWRNYDALLHDLIQEGERVLRVNSVGQEFPCHYKSCSVKEFSPEARWLEFTLTVTFTRDFRVEGKDSLLATEDYVLVATEDADDPACIIIHPKRGISYLATEAAEYVVTEDGETRIYVND